MHFSEMVNVIEASCSFILDQNPLVPGLDIMQKGLQSVHRKFGDKANDLLCVYSLVHVYVCKAMHIQRAAENRLCIRILLSIKS